MTDSYEKDGTAAAQMKEIEKIEKTRKILKMAILVSLITLFVIVAIVIAMAAKTTGGDGNSLLEQQKNEFQQNQRPTTAPVSDPTNQPTEFDWTWGPTVTRPPTDEPTISPEPTKKPTIQPSKTPTTRPSGRTPYPTPNPTPLRSANPTLSIAPTFPVQDPEHAFKMRLFWQSGYYWQEQWGERYYCMECVECEMWGMGDGWEHGCERKGDGGSDVCEEGDMLWIMDCEDRGAEFNIVSNDRSGFQLRVDGQNLCVERGVFDEVEGVFKTRILNVRKCDNTVAGQLWAPFSSLGKFELRPYDHVGRDEKDAWCVSQLHHPKSEEVLGMHSCRLSRIYETRYWEEYVE